MRQKYWVGTLSEHPASPVLGMDDDNYLEATEHLLSTTPGPVRQTLFHSPRKVGTHFNSILQVGKPKLAEGCDLFPCQGQEPKILRLAEEPAAHASQARGVGCPLPRCDFS